MSTFLRKEIMVQNRGLSTASSAHMAQGPKFSGRARAGLAGNQPLCSLKRVLCKGKWEG